MKTIKNLSVQGLEIYLKTPKGADPVYLQPRESITVPEGYLTDQVMNLVRMRMVKVW